MVSFLVGKQVCRWKNFQLLIVIGVVSLTHAENRYNVFFYFWNGKTIPVLYLFCCYVLVYR